MRALVVCGLLLGCDGHPKPACSTFSACGGDPTGAWSYVEQCGGAAMTNPFAQSCPTATFSSSPAAVNGSVHFNADKSFTEDATGSQSAHFMLPASCLGSLGSISSCQDLATQLQANPPSGLTVMASCTGTVQTSCTCDMTVNENRHLTGTWQVSGTNLIVTTSSSATSAFCVSANDLLVSTGSSGGYVLFSR
jgi:hypothetical protein